MANVKILSEEIININQIHNEDDLDLYSDQRGSKEENLTDVTNFTNGANNIIDNIIENDKEKIIEADIKAENAVRYIASILKVLSLENPIKGKEFFKNFEEDNPQIMNLIKKNDSEFKRLLYSPKTDEDIEIFKKFYKGQVNESNPDEDNIKILVDYGFSYKKSKEVYYAFDKQIELALNFLLDGN
jgi:hypothetical protein